MNLIVKIVWDVICCFIVFFVSSVALKTQFQGKRAFTCIWRLKCLLVIFKLWDKLYSAIVFVLVLKLVTPVVCLSFDESKMDFTAGGFFSQETKKYSSSSAGQMRRCILITSSCSTYAWASMNSIPCVGSMKLILSFKSITSSFNKSQACLVGTLIFF